MSVKHKVTPAIFMPPVSTRTVALLVPAMPVLLVMGNDVLVSVSSYVKRHL